MKMLGLIVLLAAGLAQGAIVQDVRAAATAQDFATGEKLAAEFKARNGVTGEYVEAYSWLARGALMGKQYAKALAYAEATRKMSLDLLKTRKLDDDKHLPTGFGASIEVTGQALAAQGQRSAGVGFLQNELAAWQRTSIRTRIQKNLNLLSLEGTPAPAIEQKEWVGAAKPFSLKGRPQVLFFWAHWCADCKQQGPVLARLQKEFKSLAVVMPTQRYGYAQGGEETSPAAEKQYIAKVRQEFYPDLTSAPAPLSEETFKLFGCSTTPTLVLVDAKGIVRLYHPGKMTYEELLPKIKALVGGAS